MGETGEKAEAKDLRKKLEGLKEEVAEIGNKVKDLVGKSSEWAQEHPGASVGIVAGVAASVGFIMGLLVGRKHD